MSTVRSVATLGVEDGRPRIDVELSGGEHGYPGVWFLLPPGSADAVDEFTLGNLAAAIGLLPALLDGGTLRVEQRMSARLRDSLRQYRDILLTWYPDWFHTFEVDAPFATDAAEAAGDRVMSFFTGGVDSFFTHLKHRDEIDTLVYVHGFDAPLSEAAALERVSGRLNEIADAAGVELVELRSNIRELLVPYADWGRATHGIALGSASIVLGALGASRVFIPSTNSYAQPNLWGSHPLLDPLWTTERTRVAHDGAEADRAAKVARIAGDPLAQKHLRVCWEQFADYNCSRCEKCVRTMMLLTAHGALDSFRTFDPEKPLSILADRPLRDDNELLNARTVLKALRTNGADEPLAKVIERRIASYPERGRVRTTEDALRRRVRSLGARTLRRWGLRGDNAAR